MSVSILDGVSRETEARLEAFVGELLRWNRAINLIAPASPAEVWDRHILDSAQLWPLRTENITHWMDLGSGGGLPGIVLAILAREDEPELRFTLVESDGRKAAFLSECIRRFELNAVVLSVRIEAMGGQTADIVSARALAPLDRLLELAEGLVAPRGILIVPKGRRVTSELTKAQQYWSIEFEAVSSRTDPEAKTLIIREFHRYHDRAS